jgi:hypothetical protein
MANITKPFSIEYVISATKKHILKSVEISIRKTIDRIAEFENDREKSEEVFRTLAELNAMKRAIEGSV